MLKTELFTDDIDERPANHARLMDGQFLVVINPPHLRPEEVVKRYKSLAGLSVGFVF